MGPKCPQCATPLVYMPQFNGWFCSRCNIYPHSVPPVQTPSTPHPSWAIIMSGINGGFALIAALFYFTIIPFLGVFTLMTSLILFSGAILISREDYNMGAVLCYIGGIITMPIGILGFMAGMKAMDCHKSRQMSPFYGTPPPMPETHRDVVEVEPIGIKVKCPKCLHAVIPMRIGRCPRCGYRFQASRKSPGQS